VILGKEWAGVAHVGWRGLASGMVERLVEKMTAYERPEDLFGFTGPAAKACCYEVGEEFRKLFPDYLEERKGHLYMDLQDAVLGELKKLGVPDTGSLERCTVCSPDLHSYRRDRSEERILTTVRVL
jgi:copper oxidase (laccase) domain-containing protein